MPRKQPLTSVHFDILRTIRELQPCGSDSIAKRLNMEPHSVRKRVFFTLYAKGLIDTELLTKSRRKPGTIHLTREGENLLNENNRSQTGNDLPESVDNSG